MINTRLALMIYDNHVIKKIKDTHTDDIYSYLPAVINIFRIRIVSVFVVLGFVS